MYVDLILNRKPNEQPWWNRPVWGENSLLEMAIDVLRKQDIHHTYIAKHNEGIEELKCIMVIANTMDNENFKNREFIKFAKIKNALKKGVEEYCGLDNSIKIMKVAIEKNESFQKIDKVESLYRGLKEQELYKFVFEQLEQNRDFEAKFLENVQQQFVELLPKVKSEEGRTALQSYMEALNALAKEKIGLKLLYFFKQDNLKYASILKGLGAIVKNIEQDNKLDLQDILLLVNAYHEDLQQLGPIIGLPEGKNEPEMYSRIIQYVVLRKKYQRLYIEFINLLEILKSGYQSYQSVINLRQEYSSRKYKQPETFTYKIPGEKLFHDYQEMLVDS